MRYIAAVIVSFVLVCFQVSAHEVKHTFTVMFPQGGSVLDRNFGTNGETMDSVIVYLEKVLRNGALHLCMIEFSGNVSPDGSSSVNRRISAGRMKSLEQYVRSRVEIPDSIIIRNGHFIEWDCLLEAVSDSSVPYREEVLRILGEDFRGTDLERKYALMALDGGRVWRDMYRRLFPVMRNAAAVVVTSFSSGFGAAESRQSGDSLSGACRFEASSPALHSAARPLSESSLVLRAGAAVSDGMEPGVPEMLGSKAGKFCMGVKTNLLYDAALVPSAGVEIPLGRHWSVTADWSYAWWSRGRADRFWRIYGGNAGVRRWFGRSGGEKLSGHHLGVSGGAFTFDFETGGNGYMGGLPGGNLWDKACWTAFVEYGYSLPLTRCLNLDFSLGLGYVGGRYQKYVPQDGNYIWQSTEKLNWAGPAKAEISLVWVIGGRGGRR